MNAETLTNGAVPEEVAQESFNDNDKEKTVEEKKTDNIGSATAITRRRRPSGRRRRVCFTANIKEALNNSRA